MAMPKLPFSDIKQKIQNLHNMEDRLIIQNNATKPYKNMCSLCDVCLHFNIHICFLFVTCFLHVDGSSHPLVKELKMKLPNDEGNSFPYTSQSYKIKHVWIENSAVSVKKSLVFTCIRAAGWNGSRPGKFFLGRYACSGKIMTFLNLKFTKIKVWFVVLVVKNFCCTKKQIGNAVANASIEKENVALKTRQEKVVEEVNQVYQELREQVREKEFNEITACRWCWRV